MGDTTKPTRKKTASQRVTETEGVLRPGEMVDMQRLATILGFDTVQGARLFCVNRSVQRWRSGKRAWASTDDVIEAIRQKPITDHVRGKRA